MDPHSPQPDPADDGESEASALFATLYAEYGDGLSEDEFCSCLDGLFAGVDPDEQAFDVIRVKDGEEFRTFLALREDLTEGLTLAVQGHLNRKQEQ